MLNSFIKYNSTHLIFIKIFYKFEIKKSLNLIKIDDLNFENFIKEISELTSSQTSQ